MAQQKASNAQMQQMEQRHGQQTQQMEQRHGQANRQQPAAHSESRPETKPVPESKPSPERHERRFGTFFKILRTLGRRPTAKLA